MKFEFTIGGYPGPFFHLRKVKNQLKCTHTLRDGMDPQFCLISIKDNERWNVLMAFLLTRKWEGQYRNDGILDGTGWDLEVKSEGLHIQTGGSNAYPPGFRKFLKLLNEVTLEEGLVVY